MMKTYGVKKGLLIKPKDIDVELDYDAMESPITVNILQ